MSENSNPTVQFALRMEPGLRDRIKEASAANSRSMNAEIIATLMETYPEPATDLLMQEMAELLSATAQLSQNERANAFGEAIRRHFMERKLKADEIGFLAAILGEALELSAPTDD